MIAPAIIEVMKDNFQENEKLGWQYFGSEQGVHRVYPAHEIAGDCVQYDPRRR